MITIVGHKFYGPRIGALFCKNPENIIRPMFFGGNQERGYRLVSNFLLVFDSGNVQNVLKIVALVICWHPCPIIPSKINVFSNKSLKGEKPQVLKKEV